MRSELEKFVDACQTSFHVKTLFPIEPMFFTFHISNGTPHYIMVSQSKCSVLDNPPESTDFVLKGEKSSFLRLFYENTRLTTLVDQSELTIEGPYRHMLFIESLLWLCRSRSQESMIV